MNDTGWIGVDLDGTLAFYDGWVSHTHIGEPINLMTQRVKGWIENGWTVKVFTARVSDPDRFRVVQFKSALRLWCREHIGYELDVTNVKDFNMIELWDDRAVGVEANTGIATRESTRGLI